MAFSDSTAAPDNAALGRRPPAPLPLTLITGFLGAGKTTLLNRLLADPALSETMVIVNEFGEIGLDHLLIEKVDSDLLLMSSGCLCCTIRGDLVTTLEDLLRRRDNGRVTPFRRVVIETTGLADPAPILHTIMYHPYLMLRYRLDGVVTLVDAINGLATLDAHEEAVKQAAVADRLVVTKTDLAVTIEQEAALAELQARLAALNPGALLIDADDATAANLLDAGLYDVDGKGPDVRRWLNAEAVEAQQEHHNHDHEHHHAGAGQDPHDVNRHDARIRAYCLRSEALLAPGSFDIFIDLLRQAHGPKLLRVKGLIALSDDPQRPVVIHGVQHVFHPPVRLDHWPSEDHSTRIVFILQDLAPSFVDSLWSAFTNAPKTDTPDSAGLTDNPLRPKAGGLFG